MGSKIRFYLRTLWVTAKQRMLRVRSVVKNFLTSSFLNSKRNRKFYNLFSAVLIFLSALVVLTDFSPIRLFPFWMKQTSAINFLKDEKNVIKNIVPSYVREKIVLNRIVEHEKYFDYLFKFIQRNAPQKTGVDMNKVVGVGYYSYLVPVGRSNISVSDPLYYILRFPEENNRFELEPVGRLQDLYKWTEHVEQKWVLATSLFLLGIGFLLQFFSGMLAD